MQISDCLICTRPWKFSVRIYKYALNELITFSSLYFQIRIKCRESKIKGKESNEIDQVIRFRWLFVQFGDGWICHPYFSFKIINLAVESSGSGPPHDPP